MKKMYKAMALVLCALLLVAGSVMGTLAYLQAQTDPVRNTFAVGKVAITLKETAIDPETGKEITGDPVTGLTNIKLVPGREIKKNPFVTVEAGSEKCYVFVKLENNIPTTYGTLNGFADTWSLIDETNKIYAYTGTLATNGVVDASTAEKKLDVFNSFTCANNINAYGGETNLAINITAYAVQAEGFADMNNSGTAADEAWAASGFGTTNSNP